VKDSGAELSGHMIMWSRVVVMWRNPEREELLPGVATRQPSQRQTVYTAAPVRAWWPMASRPFLVIIIRDGPIISRTGWLADRPVSIFVDQLNSDAGVGTPQFMATQHTDRTECLYHHHYLRSRLVPISSFPVLAYIVIYEYKAIGWPPTMLQLRVFFRLWECIMRSS